MHGATIAIYANMKVTPKQTNKQTNKQKRMDTKKTE